MNDDILYIVMLKDDKIQRTQILSFEQEWNEMSLSKLPLLSK